MRNNYIKGIFTLDLINVGDEKFIIIFSFQIAISVNKVLLAISHSFNLIIYCLSSKSFRKMAFRRFSGESRRSSEAVSERLNVFGYEMRALREMVILIQQSAVLPETQYITERRTRYNTDTTLILPRKACLLQQASLSYLDLALHRRKIENDELIIVPKSNLIAANTSKSCSILSHLKNC